MKKLFAIIFFVFPVIGYLVFLIQFKLNVTRNELNLESPSTYYDYKGIANVHSNLSTGSLPPKDIIEIAIELNFDFILMSEVNTFPAPKYLNGYHGKLLSIVGGEYSYLDSSLLMFANNEVEPPEQKGQMQVYFTDFLSREDASNEAFVYLAHPFLNRSRWDGDYPPGLRGIEIINLKRVLEKAWDDSKISSIGSLFMYPFNPHLSMIRLYENPKDELELWDDLNKKRKTIGMFGADATAKAVITPGFSLEFPSYKTSLAIGSNHVLLKSELTGDYAKDRKKILSALTNGQFYFALDIIANPRGFYSEIRDGRKTFPMGSELKLTDGLNLHVSLPQGLEAPFEINLIKDGRVLVNSHRKSDEFPIKDKGVYRIEVRVIPIFPLPGGKRWLPWIYSNAFYVR